KPVFIERYGHQPPVAIKAIYNPILNESEFIYNLNYVVDGIDMNDVNGVVLNGLCCDTSEVAYFAIRTPEYFKGIKYDQVFESIIIFNQKEIIYNSSDDIHFNNADVLDSMAKSNHGGTIHNIRMNNEDKRVVIVPFPFLNENTRIAGIISEKMIKTKTRSINVELLFIMVGLILILFTSFPIFKLCLINDRERLNTSDATISIISLVFNIALLFILVYGTSKQYIVTSKVQKDRLISIGDSLCNNFHSDLKAVFAFYKELKCGDKQNCIANNFYIDTNVTDDTKDMLTLRELRTILKNKSQEYNVIPINQKYYKSTPKSKLNYYSSIPVNDIMFITNDGYCKKSISYNYQPAKKHNELDLQHRHYVQCISDMSKSWHWNDSVIYYLQSIRAYGTGVGETAISFPYTDTFDVLGGGKQITTDILAITSTLPSVYHQVLPFDIQMAIIDEEGNTLFHSEHNRILHENIFEESELDKIESFIKFKHRKIVKVDYHQIQWYAYVQPVADTPLYFVTLLNRDLIREKSARITLFSLYLIIFFGIAVYLGTLVLNYYQNKNTFLQRHVYTYNWLVFNPQNRKEYAILLACTVFLILVQLIFVFAVDYIRRLLLVHMLIGTIATVASVIVLKHIEFKKNKRDERKLDKQKQSTLYIYRTYIVCWLFLISLVPSMHIYRVISQKEDVLWNRYNMEHFARKNLENLNRYQVSKNDSIYPWLKRTQGHNIDNFQVELVEDTVIVKQVERFHLYEYFPTNFIRLFKTELRPFLYAKHMNGDEVFVENSLYHKTGIGKVLKISKVGDKPFKSRIILVWGILLVVGFFLFHLIMYLMRQLMYADFSDWIKTESLKWDQIMNLEEYRRILLINYNYEMYIEDAKRDYSAHVLELKRLNTDDSDYDILKDSNNKVFVTGLEWQINDIKQHDEILSNLEYIIKRSNATLIICSPFEIEYIQDTLDTYFGGENKSEDQLNQYNLILGRWESIFRNFYKYLGHVFDEENGRLKQMREGSDLECLLATELSLVPQLVDSYKENVEQKYGNRIKNNISPELREELILGIQQHLEPKYYFIWKYCTPLEKLILYDLAEDGMVNTKNSYLINRLVSKRIVTIDNQPKIFSESFKNFILTSVRELEAKQLEKLLSEQGQWSNFRLFIVSILLSIIIFVFVIQGRTVDQAIGVLTAFVALVPAVIKLIDNRLNKRTK
ncbi:MAG: hypothetical protein MI922_18995, partial [Bacteroidales bacterium]|nr:hypothetical protein [Bacteroidales bacterium]